MKFSEVALTVLIVLAVVIVVILLSSKNPERGLVAPLVVPVRTFFGYLGGRGGNGGDTHIHNKIKIKVKGGGGVVGSSSGPALGPPILSGPIGPILPPSGLGPIPPISPFTNYSAY